MTRSSKSKSRFNPSNLILLSVVVIASLTYVAYYSNLAMRTHSDVNNGDHGNPSATSNTADHLSDEDYVAYILKVEAKNKAERVNRRQDFEQSSEPQFYSEPLGERYIAELEASLEQIPLDQPALRKPIEERLANALDE